MSWPAHAAFAAAAVAVAALAADDRSAEVETVFSFTDPAIDESSGLVTLGDRVLTVNDSGDGAVVYLVDPESGDTVGRTTYASDEVEDVEALAAGPDGEIWVGDIGDNYAGREVVSVYRLPAVEEGDRTVTAERFDLRYPEGAQNAETLMADPRDGRLFVVTKGVLGGRVYAAPRTLDAQRVNVLKVVGRADGLVTDGAFFPGGSHAVLRTYGVATVYDTATWESLATMRLPNQPQGEGVAVTDGGRRLLVSSERKYADVLSVALTKGMLAAVSGEPPSGSDPGSDTSAEPGNGTTADEAASERTPPWRDPLVVGALVAAVVAGVLAVRGLRNRAL